MWSLWQGQSSLLKVKKKKCLTVKRLISGSKHYKRYTNSLSHCRLLVFLCFYLSFDSIGIGGSFLHYNKETNPVERSNVSQLSDKGFNTFD